MTSKSTYNGHPNYNAWNVALWLGNDHGLHSLARSFLKHVKPKEAAAVAMLEALQQKGHHKTPDGVPYTKRSILHAMRGLA